MSDYKYKLDKSSKKFLCPECDKKRFVLYIDEAGNYLPAQYGRCDREAQCGYHLDPYKDGYAKAIRDQEQPPQRHFHRRPAKVVKAKTLSPIPFEVLKETLSGYEQNGFVQNLLANVPFPFEAKDIEKAISQYFLGTILSGYRSGAIAFPFIDKGKNIRAIQVKQFDQDHHTIGTDFLHSIISKQHAEKNELLPDWLKAYNENEIKVSCLFGEHLLSKYPTNPVALVEAPKTAIYGTLYFGFPEQPKNLLWLAVYNLSSLNLEKCKALEGRNVFLFPDLSEGGKAFDLWSNKAKEIQKQLKGSSFTVSDMLEKLAPEKDREKGKDLADYLIYHDWRKFRKEPTPEPEIINVVSVANVDENKPFLIEAEPVKDWSNEIEQLEKFFNNTTLPTEPIRLNQCSIINSVSDFIEGHLQASKTYNGKRIGLAYLDRLRQLQVILN